MTKQHYNCQNLCWRFHEGSYSVDMLKKPVIYKRGARIVIVFWCNWCAGLFCVVSARPCMAGACWWKWRHWGATILQLHSLCHTSDFYWRFWKNMMCWQQHLPGNSLEKNGHTDNKISRADFQEAGVEDWCLCRLSLCTTSPVLLILKTLSLSGNYLLWLYLELPAPLLA